MNLPIVVLCLPTALAAPCPEPAPRLVEEDPRINERPTRPARQIRWADANHVREPAPELTLQWLLWQLIPSPELGFGDSGAVFGLRWQFTPVLYSFGIDSRLKPWRWILAEPIVRQSGAIELFVSPEYLTRSGDRFGVRVGLRSYFGLIQRGDYLSVSLGSAYYRFGALDGASYEAGVYVLFGILGFQLGYSPGMHDASWLATLRLRFF